jgi:membrane protease YdiL (CAAX protease family)
LISISCSSKNNIVFTAYLSVKNIQVGGRKMKLLKKLGNLILVLIVVTVIPILSAKIMAYILSYICVFDPSRVFLPVSIHHIAQLILTILVMLFYRRMKLSEWGFNFKDKDKSFKFLAWFAVIWTAYEFIVGVLPYLISKQPRALGYDANAFNVIGVLAFQGLISGTCEEPLFRGYVMTALSKSWNNRSIIKIKNFDITSIDFASALIFVYAHINIRFIPFSMQYNYMQLIISFVLGLVYAQAFRRTKSLMGPILLHNLSNVIVILARLIPIWVLGQ